MDRAQKRDTQSGDRQVEGRLDHQNSGAHRCAWQPRALYPAAGQLVRHGGCGPLDPRDQLRRDAPVFWYQRDDIEPFWAITRYDDVKFVGANDKLFCNGGGRLRLASRQDDIDMWQRSRARVERFGWDLDEVPDFIYMDRPRHTSFRNLAARSFTPRAMRLLEEHLAQYAVRFVGELEAKLMRDGEADLVELPAAAAEGAPT